VEDGSGDVSTTLDGTLSQDDGSVNIIIFAVHGQDGNRLRELEDAAVNPGDGRDATMDTAPVGIEDDTAGIDTAKKLTLSAALCRYCASS
jgi:hypothetical protein